MGRVEQAIERATSPKINSVQPRFYTKKDRIYAYLRDLFELAEMVEPAYSPDTRRRDAWLRSFAKSESHLAGVINSVVAIDKNRGWNLIGGRNQVARYRRTLLHDIDGGTGWRMFCSRVSEAFYTSDLGPPVEIEREGESGPMRNLYFLDPVCCYVTGNAEYPLKYTPADSLRPRLKLSRDDKESSRPLRDLTSTVALAPEDFFRVTSMPSTDERYHGVGFSAVSRAAQFAKMMYSVFAYDQEMLGARMPRGILLLNNIDEEQWEAALQSRSLELASREQQWFGNVMVLANNSMDQATIQLTGLSNLPEEFDRKEFVAYTMAGIALCFGFDPGEFWLIEGGNLGHSEETKVQHRKASGKGARDFALAFQQGIQRTLDGIGGRLSPLTFEFEERDAEGLQFDANLAKTYADTILSLARTSVETGEEEEREEVDPLTGQASTVTSAVTRPIISWEEARMLLADRGIIPPAWTESIVEAEANDSAPMRIRMLREMLIEEPRVRLACERFGDEPIVRYTYDGELGKGRTIKLWESGRDALRNHTYRGVSLPDPQPSSLPERLDPSQLFILTRATLAASAQSYLDGASNFSQARRTFMATLDTAWRRAADLLEREGCQGSGPENTEHMFDVSLLVGREMAAADKLWDEIMAARSKDSDAQAIAVSRAGAWARAVEMWYKERVDA